MTISRREILAVSGVVAAASLAGTATARAAAAAPASVEAFSAAGEHTSLLVEFGPPTDPVRWALRPDEPMFVGSAVKTFILAQYLRDIESGRLEQNVQLAIDDAVRSVSSPVFLNLTGTTQVKSVLEAMIAHSDNTATDIALGKTGPERVRALVAEAGLTATRIPTSTRRLFSWLAGADKGVDLGWDGMEKLAGGWSPGPSREAINDTETMMSTASDMVRWYAAALAGTYFAKPETLVEFKRIQAMADALPLILPENVFGFAKGGSIDWGDFHCFCIAGQMIVRDKPATFCFTVNWRGDDATIQPTFQRFKEAAAAVVSDAVAALRA